MKKLIVLIVTLQVGASHAWAQEGTRPQLPLSHRFSQELKQTPGAFPALGAKLPSVAPEPGRTAAPPLKVFESQARSVFALQQAPIAAWSNLLNTTPGGSYNLGNPLLLTDGTVIVHRTDKPDWYRLTPSINGSYVDGTWSKLASLPPNYAPKFFASAVLPDGRVIVEGGEYNNDNQNWGTLGAIFDPTAGPMGAWTPVAPPQGWTTIGDAQSTVLANGAFMLSSCCDVPYRAALLDPKTLTWKETGFNKADRYDEESWTLLPDGDVLTVNAYTTPIGSVSCGLGSERYNAKQGSWSAAGDVRAQLSDCNAANTAPPTGPSFEIGPQVLSYSGKVVAFGGTTANIAHTALYDVASRKWSAGADLPSLCGPPGNQPCTLADAPATLLPNGKVLYAASAGKFTPPTKFFEYDPTADKHTAAAGTSDAARIASFYVNFLTLPTGQILAVETYTSTIQIYTPSGYYQQSWQPVVSSAPSCIARKGDYVIKGKQLNGLSQAANYGDDQQAATNYPLVRIANNSTGHVFYARTHDHSTMTVAPNADGATHFEVSAGTEAGASTLFVVANGIPSAGIPVTVAADACPMAERESTKGN